MKREIIGEASTIEEAKEKAMALLAAPADADIAIEIVAMPQKKVFGLFGGSPAKVKVSFDDGRPAPKPAEAPKKEPKLPQIEKQPKAEKPSKPVKQEPKKPVPPAVDKKIEAPAKESDASSSAYPSDEKTAAAVAYLQSILAGLHVADVTVKPQQSDNGLLLEINCEDYGIIIGRRGETLDAIQYLVSLLVNKGTGDYVRVALNVGNYREKREETLRHLAQKNAAHVLRSGRRVMLEPMNPYERRIIHTSIQEMKGVNSRSVGSNNERKVIIELADGVKPTGGYQERRDRGERNDRDSDRGNRSRPASRGAAPAASSRKLTKDELPKFGKIQ